MTTPFTFLFWYGMIKLSYHMFCFNHFDSNLEWSEIMGIKEILSEFLITAGGAGVAIIAVIKFLATKISDRITINYKNRLEKQMELFRVKTENKKYVTQFRFNQEYKIIQKLYRDLFEFTSLTFSVLVIVTSDDDDKAQEIIEDFKHKCDAYTKYFFQNDVFIEQELSDTLKKVVEMLNEFCTISIYVRKEYVKYRDSNVLETDGYTTHISNNVANLESIHNELNAGNKYSFEKINSMIRLYFDSLEVIR